MGFLLVFLLFDLVLLLLLSGFFFGPFLWFPLCILNGKIMSSPLVESKPMKSS